MSPREMQLAIEAFLDGYAASLDGVRTDRATEAAVNWVHNGGQSSSMRRALSKMPQAPAPLRPRQIDTDPPPPELLAAGRVAVIHNRRIVPASPVSHWEDRLGAPMYDVTHWVELPEELTEWTH